MFFPPPVREHIGIVVMSYPNYLSIQELFKTSSQSLIQLQEGAVLLLDWSHCERHERKRLTIFDHRLIYWSY